MLFGCCSWGGCNHCVGFAWETFCNLWYFIAMNNALVEINKILLADMEKTEYLLSRSTSKFKNKFRKKFSSIDITDATFKV